MIKLFDIIPSGFFNCLSSGSNHRIYSDCLQIIYEQYDREISYRIVRNRIRDAIAVYLLENHVDFVETEEDTRNSIGGIFAAACKAGAGGVFQLHF